MTDAAVLAPALNLSWLEPELAALVPQLSEVQHVAVTLYGEARSEQVEGILAVANVIRNRVIADLGGDDKPDWWGEGYSGVVLQRLQFSCWTPKGGPDNYDKVLKLVQAIASGKPITEAAMPQQGFRARQCIWVAHGVIGNADGPWARDNVKGANHYHTVQMQPRPKWAKDKVAVKQIGGHLFYKL